VTMASGVEV